MKSLPVMFLGLLLVCPALAAPYVGLYDPGVMGPPATPAIVQAALAAPAAIILKKSRRCMIVPFDWVPSESSWALPDANSKESLARP